MKDYLQNGITIFADAQRIANHYKLTAGQRLIYQIIYSYCEKGKDKDCRQSITFFQQWTGMTRRGVYLALDALEAANLIERQRFTKENSEVEYRRYTLIKQEQDIITPAAQKAEIKALAALRVAELRRKKTEKDLAKKGLYPLPPELEGKGWIALRKGDKGQFFLIPDGVKKTFEERYYTKEEHAKLFGNTSNLDDINI